eukprot:TRINITY_DN9458_c0_g1_i2.p1 TRINITY_DN9458_c0_g1~~TRINITY_DN9458_c0_g1_i2.p1  ORF type:complete len:336 (+),score=76.09 TRINITY_DN9458_c0_g1_i2:846-1853(+)
MLQGYQVTMILFSALDLGIFNSLHKQPNFTAKFDVIANDLGLKKRGIKRILNALVAVGILFSGEDGIYSLTETAITHLVKGLPGYVGDLRFTLANEHQWNAMRRLSQVIKGESPIEIPKDVTNDTAFRQHVAMVLTTVLSTWEKRRKRLTVLDLFGGNGLLGSCIAMKNTNAKVYSMDKKDRILTAKLFAEKMNVSDRMNFISIDYMETGDDFHKVDVLGPYDLIIVGDNILNTFGWENSVKFLQQVGDTLQDTGRIVFLEMIAGIDATPDAMLSSITMLTTQKKGKVHSLEWFNELLEESGFAPATVNNLDHFHEKLMVTSRNIITQKRKMNKE